MKRILRERREPSWANAVMVFGSFSQKGCGVSLNSRRTLTPTRRFQIGWTPPLRFFLSTLVLLFSLRTRILSRRTGKAEPRFVPSYRFFFFSSPPDPTSVPIPFAPRQPFWFDADKSCKLPITLCSDGPPFFSQWVSRIFLIFRAARQRVPGVLKKSFLRQILLLCFSFVPFFVSISEWLSQDARTPRRFGEWGWNGKGSGPDCWLRTFFLFKSSRCLPLFFPARRRRTSFVTDEQVRRGYFLWCFSHFLWCSPRDSLLWRRQKPYRLIGSDILHFFSLAGVAFSSPPAWTCKASFFFFLGWTTM